MDDLKVTSVGLYREPQIKSSQQIESFWIAFYVKGFSNLNLFRTDGKQIFDLNKDKIPVMMIAVPGMKIEFAANSERENWVIMFNSDNIRESDNSADIEVKNHGKWIILPSISFVSEEYLNHWRNEFQLMLNAYLNPVPFNIMRLELGINNMFRFVMDNIRFSVLDKFNPAEKLKQLIDEDLSMQHNISELSEICGYSSDHLRILFQQCYHTSPLIYRNRQRMTNAMDLIVNTSLSLKEIAAKVGFSHQTHFCTAFKKEFSTSPAQALKKYRIR